MQTVYENLIDIDEPDPNMVRYAGYASVVAADFYRRRGVAAAALQAYDRAIELYDLASAAVPAWKDAADRPVALAFAGKARLAYERGDDAAATADIITSFARSPGSVGTKDDLGITPAATAKLSDEACPRMGRRTISWQISSCSGVNPCLSSPNSKIAGRA